MSKAGLQQFIARASKTGGFKYLIRTVDIEQVELHLLVKPDTRTANLKILTKY